jgi:two-component system, response regulator
MVITEYRGQQSRGTLLKRVTEFARWITQPTENTEPEQSVDICLLSPSLSRWGSTCWLQDGEPLSISNFKLAGTCMFDETIMLIEDNPDDVELTLRVFRKNNIADHTMVVHDGIEALDYLLCRGAYCSRNIKEQPKLVLLDLNLPRMNGLQVLEQIRAAQSTRLLPVVVLTSSKAEADLISSYKNGANSSVRKPLDFKQVVEAVRDIGLHWPLINEPTTS